MSQQVRVERDLVFAGYAATTPNIKGPMMSELKIFDAIFTDDAHGDWAERESQGVTIAHSAVDGGAMTMTGDNAAEDDCGELSHTAQWSAASNCGVEIKAKMSTASGMCVALGLVDVREAADGHIAGELDSSADLRDPTNTGDAALMIFDTDAPDYWYCACINNDGIGTAVVTVGSLVPVADTYFRVRVQTDDSGNVTFYYNGVAVGYRGYVVDSEGVAYGAGNLLTPYVGFITRTQAASIVTVSRITTWQDCS